MAEKRSKDESIKYVAGIMYTRNWHTSVYGERYDTPEDFFNAIKENKCIINVFVTDGDHYPTDYTIGIYPKDDYAQEVYETYEKHGGEWTSNPFKEAIFYDTKHRNNFDINTKTYNVLSFYKKGEEYDEYYRPALAFIRENYIITKEAKDAIIKNMDFIKWQDYKQCLMNKENGRFASPEIQDSWELTQDEIDMLYKNFEKGDLISGLKFIKQIGIPADKYLMPLQEKYENALFSYKGERFKELIDKGSGYLQIDFDEMTQNAFLEKVENEFREGEIPYEKLWIMSSSIEWKNEINKRFIESFEADKSLNIDRWFKYFLNKYDYMTKEERKDEVNSLIKYASTKGIRWNSPKYRMEDLLEELDQEKNPKTEEISKLYRKEMDRQGIGNDIKLSEAFLKKEKEFNEIIEDDHFHMHKAVKIFGDLTAKYGNKEEYQYELSVMEKHFNRALCDRYKDSILELKEVVIKTEYKGEYDNRFLRGLDDSITLKFRWQDEIGRSGKYKDIEADWILDSRAIRDLSDNLDGLVASIRNRINKEYGYWDVYLTDIKEANKEECNYNNLMIASKYGSLEELFDNSKDISEKVQMIIDNKSNNQDWAIITSDMKKEILNSKVSYLDKIAALGTFDACQERENDLYLNAAQKIGLFSQANTLQEKIMYVRCMQDVPKSVESIIKHNIERVVNSDIEKQEKNVAKNLEQFDKLMQVYDGKPPVEYNETGFNKVVDYYNADLQDWYKKNEIKGTVPQKMVLEKQREILEGITRFKINDRLYKKFEETMDYWTIITSSSKDFNYINKICSRINNQSFTEKVFEQTKENLYELLSENEAREAIKGAKGEYWNCVRGKIDLVQENNIITIKTENPIDEKKAQQIYDKILRDTDWLKNIVAKGIGVVDQENDIRNYGTDEIKDR